MNVISNIMVGTGMALILIGVIGLVLSWVCEGEERETVERETVAIDDRRYMGRGTSAEAGTSSVSAEGAATFPRGEGLGTMKEE